MGGPGDGAGPPVAARVRGAFGALSPRDRWIAGGVLLVALAARLVAIAATAGYAPGVDDASYDLYARSIADGEGYPESIFAPAGGPSAFWPPGYPYFLAGIYTVLGHGWDVARVVQAFVGVGAVALAGTLAWQLAGRRAGLVTAAVAAVYPPLVLTSATLYTEGLFIALALAAMVAALHHRRRGSGVAWAAAAGALGGLSILVRPIGIFMLAALAVGLLGSGPLLRRLRAPAVMALAAALVLSPWVIRNMAVMDEPLFSTNLAYVLAGTYNETSRNDEEHPAAWRPPNLAREFDPLLAPGSGLDERRLAERFQEEAFEHIGDHPLYPLRVAGLNTLRTFDLYGGHERSRTVYHEQGFGVRTADLAIVSSYVLLALALAGAFTHAARRVPRFVWAVPVLLLAGAVIGQGVSRYRLPLDPFFALLAALALISARDRLRGRETAAP